MKSLESGGVGFCPHPIILPSVFRTRLVPPADIWDTFSSDSSRVLYEQRINKYPDIAFYYFDVASLTKILGKKFSIIRNIGHSRIGIRRRNFMFLKILGGIFTLGLLPLIQTIAREKRAKREQIARLDRLKRCMRYEDE